MALGVLLVLFFAFDWFPALDDVREEVRGVGEPELRCVQGVCEEVAPSPPLLERWWRTSIVYLQIVALGMLLATVAAATTEALLSGARGTEQPAPAKRAGLPGRNPAEVSSASTLLALDLPGLVMAALVFGPLLGISRFVLAFFAAILVGPVLFRSFGARTREHQADAEEGTAAPAEEASQSWSHELKESVAEWALAARRYLLALALIVLVTSIIAGPALDLVSAQAMDEVVGDGVVGIVLAATVGLLIGPRLLLAVPAALLLVVMGMGLAPVAALLFVVATPGRVGLRSLAKLSPRSREAGLTAATWAVGIAGGLALLQLSALPGSDTSVARTSDPSAPTIFADATEISGTGFVHTQHEEMFPFGGGVVVSDFDGDGLDDIFVANSNGPNALYRNDGDATFTDVAEMAGVDDALGRSNGGCAADYDNDGDRDLYLTNYGPSRLFANNGDGTFTDATAQAGVHDPSSGGPDDAGDLDVKRSMGCAWGDYDADGFVDLIIVRHLHEYGAMTMSNRDFYERTGGLVLFRNNGDGTFVDTTTLLGETERTRMIAGDNIVPEGEPVRDTDVTRGVDFNEIWGTGFQPGWADFDNDGDLDLYVVNDLGLEIQPNVMWRNDGPGTDGDWVFSDVSIESNANPSINGMSLAVADYDRDGFLDVFMTNIGDNVLLRHDGNSLSFTDVTQEAAAAVGKIGDESRVAWGAVFFDFDNDMDEDLYVVSGHLNFVFPVNPKEQPNVLLRNDGGAFSDVSNISGADDAGVGRGAAYLDFNGDGCLDLFITNYGQQAKLLQNACDTGNSWLVIQPVGTVSNRDGIGARISVVTGDVTQIREIASGASQMGQNMLAAHFGMGSAQTADVVTVRWPSGVEVTLADVASNQRVIVTEPR